MAATNEPTEDAPLIDLNDFRRDLLFALSALEKPSGADVKKMIDGVYETSVNHGRLYPALDDLVQCGLVKKSEKDRRTNCYEITSRGRREMKADLRWRKRLAGDIDGE